MDTCLIQLIDPKGMGKNIAGWLEEDMIDFWTVELGDSLVQHNIISENTSVEQIIDKLDDHAGRHAACHLFLQPGIH